jgi:hypothetical protein
LLSICWCISRPALCFFLATSDFLQSSNLILHRLYITKAEKPSIVLQGKGFSISFVGVGNVPAARAIFQKPALFLSEFCHVTNYVLMPTVCGNVLTEQHLKFV